MGTLVARGVTASYGGVPVLHGVDVVVGPGSKLGLVGPNGAGKTTLLRVLSGELPPELGTVTATGTVGHLPQEPDRRPGETLLAYLGRRTGVTAADDALQQAADGLASDTAEAATAYDLALARWLDLGGADLDTRAEQTCADLGLSTALLHAPTLGLSGGQMARASLAAVLLSRFDILLLDEPTNDLDLDGLARIEDFVSGLRGGLVVVSHDREFLARTITGVLELDPHNKASREFAGGWDAYLDERAVARRHAREQYDDYAEKRGELQGRVQATREMSVRGALRAKRKMPDNDRAAKGARIEAATSAASKVRSLESRLAHLDATPSPSPARSGSCASSCPRRPARVTWSRRCARGRTRGSFTLGPVDLTCAGRTRCGASDRTAGGKTTCCRRCSAGCRSSEGTCALGRGVVVGELDQVRREFSTDATVVDVLAEATELGARGAAHAASRSSGSPAPHVTRPLSSLSPGERTRAGLALLMARGPTAWCWTSRPTTSTCRRSSSWRARSPTTRER
jgi:ATPase subunit of ABC transporter with duplicated ATPase domains